MRKDIGEKWVKALRSGEYKQGKGRLHVGDKFCCLGVLCDLAVKAGVNVDVIQIEKVYAYDMSENVLPLRIREWAGIKNAYGQYDRSEKDVAYLNDEGKSFEKIADIIEKNVEKI